MWKGQTLVADNGEFRLSEQWLASEAQTLPIVSITGDRALLQALSPLYTPASSEASLQVAKLADPAYIAVQTKSSGGTEEELKAWVFAAYIADVWTLPVLRASWGPAEEAKLRAVVGVLRKLGADRRRRLVVLVQDAQHYKVSAGQFQHQTAWEDTQQWLLSRILSIDSLIHTSFEVLVLPFKFNPRDYAYDPMDLQELRLALPITVVATSLRERIRVWRQVWTDAIPSAFQHFVEAKTTEMIASVLEPQWESWQLIEEKASKELETDLESVSQLGLAAWISLETVTVHAPVCIKQAQSKALGRTLTSRCGRLQGLVRTRRARIEEMYRSYFAQSYQRIQPNIKTGYEEIPALAEKESRELGEALLTDTSIGLAQSLQERLYTQLAINLLLKQVVILRNSKGLHWGWFWLLLLLFFVLGAAGGYFWAQPQGKCCFAYVQYEEGLYYGEVDAQGRRQGFGVLNFTNGSRYEGKWQADEMTGRGVMETATGDVYDGHWANRTFVGLGSLQTANSHYIGIWTAGLKSGPGVQIWAPGTVYAGEWLSGEQHGLGTFRPSTPPARIALSHTSPTTYSGQWTNGTRTGLGVTESASGTLSVGWHRQGVLDGPGTVIDPVRGVQSGLFSSGNLNGTGVEITPEGRVQTGQFCNNTLEGLGTLQNKEVQYSGQFRKGRLEGCGAAIKANGEWSAGLLGNGVLAGFGVVIRPSGYQAAGFFQNGSLSGLGTVVTEQGTQASGTFLNGSLSGYGVLHSSSTPNSPRSPLVHSRLAAFATSLELPRDEVRAGLFKTGRLEGIGVCRAAEGRQMAGEYRTGSFAGLGAVLYSNGSKAVGLFTNTDMSGIGAVQRENGDLEAGFFTNSTLAGLGVACQGNGTCQTGNFEQGQLSGPGAFVSPTLSQAGLYSNGALSGVGIAVTATGEKKAGQFAAGLLEGLGMFIGADSSRTVGDFREGEMQGFGLWRSPEGELQAGQFLHYQLEGPGMVCSGTGNLSVGVYANGGLNGPGIRISPDQDTYIGVFRQNQISGLALIVPNRPLSRPLRLGFLVNNTWEGLGATLLPNNHTTIGIYKQGQLTGLHGEQLPNKDLYIGELQSSYRSGLGAYYHASTGHMYAGEWKLGLQEGLGSWSSDTGEMYSGNWVNGSRSGLGVTSWANGQYYAGEMDSGQFSGLGAFLSPKRKYAGLYRTNQFHGLGVLISEQEEVAGQWMEGNLTGLGVRFSAGIQEAGHFMNGSLTGLSVQSEAGNELISYIEEGSSSRLGAMRYSTGCIYIGELNSGQRHGLGIYRWLDGHQYSGQWANDQREGLGIRLLESGELYAGLWSHDFKIGFGAYRWPSGDLFAGQGANGTLDGLGAYQSSNGVKYVGQYRESQYHGLGFYYSSTLTYGGFWEAGLMVGLGLQTFVGVKRPPLVVSPSVPSLTAYYRVSALVGLTPALPVQANSPKVSSKASPSAPLQKDGNTPVNGKRTKLVA